MCGISVIVAFQGPVDPVRQNAKTDSTAVNHDGSRSSSMNAKIKKELDESLDRIAHRGPDARGQWISPDNRIGCFSLVSPRATRSSQSIADRDA